MRILVTDGNNRASLAVTRSLGASGHDVFVAEKNEKCLSGASKYARGVFRYPDYEHSPECFVNTLAELTKTERIDALFPVSDISSFLVSAMRSQFPPACLVALADHESLQFAADKLRIAMLAMELGVPIPLTRVIRSPDEINGDLQIPEFPIVVKASHSRIASPDGWIHTRVDYANNMDELGQLIRCKKEEEFPILLQERIIGEGMGLFLCSEHGTPIALFSHRRIREKPPSGGVSVLRESIPLDPTVLEYAQRLIRRLNWHGVAMVEFKRDVRDGIPKLMEINGRFWGSLQLAVDSGVDFPNILLDMLTGKARPPVDRYEIGVKTRWLLGDVDRLLMILTKSRHALKLPPNHSGRLQSVSEFLRFWSTKQRYEILRISDLRPFIYELSQWLRGRSL